MATAPSPNDLTRQQLDELDALLQRMLSVPLSPAETPMPASMPAPVPIPPAAPNWRVDPPAPAPVPTPRLVFQEPPASVSLPREVIEAPTPAAAMPVAKAANPAPPPAPELPLATELPEPVAPPVPLPYLPLVAINTAFDFTCGLLGAPGRLLRSGFFKQLYGLAGLGLLVYTAAHIAQAKGWLTLPVQLPWPASH